MFGVITGCCGCCGSCAGTGLVIRADMKAAVIRPIKIKPAQRCIRRTARRASDILILLILHQKFLMGGHVSIKLPLFISTNDCCLRGMRKLYAEEYPVSRKIDSPV